MKCLQCNAPIPGVPEYMDGLIPMRCGPCSNREQIKRERAGVARTIQEAGNKRNTSRWGSGASKETLPVLEDRT